MINDDSRVASAVPSFCAHCSNSFNHHSAIPLSYYRIILMTVMARLSKHKQSIRETIGESEAAQGQENTGGARVGVFRGGGGCHSSRVAMVGDIYPCLTGGSPC